MSRCDTNKSCKPFCCFSFKNCYLLAAQCLISHFAFILHELAKKIFGSSRSTNAAGRIRTPRCRTKPLFAL